MEFISENTAFASGSHRERKAGRRGEGRCRVLSVNFRKLKMSANPESCCEWSWEELMHSVAGLCSSCLPDMEISAIYSSLTAPGTKTVVLLDKEVVSTGTASSTSQEMGGGQGAIKSGQPCRREGNQVQVSAQESSSRTAAASSSADCEEEEGQLSELFSASEESDSEGDPDLDDEFAAGRKHFVATALSRRGVGEVGPEHCVVGCVTVLRLSSKPGACAVQILLLAVRRGWRGLGAGSYLIQCSKDPDIVGHYDVLLVFADHKAESFFTRHGFSDDPIITSAYRDLVDSWDNSILMAFLTPFSGQTSPAGSLKSLTNFEDHYKLWRASAISAYSAQLSFMERLKHEVLLLHAKVQSQEEVITELSRELHQVRQEKGLVEAEFAQYRKHVQRLLCEAAVGSAEQWLNSIESTST